LQGDFGRQFGVLDRVQNAAVAANGLVLRQATARLTHEPHGRMRCSLTTGSGKKRVVRVAGDHPSNAIGAHEIAANAVCVNSLSRRQHHAALWVAGGPVVWVVPLG
jgi:hypothetical protein